MNLGYNLSEQFGIILEAFVVGCALNVIYSLLKSLSLKLFISSVKMNGVGKLKPLNKKRGFVFELITDTLFSLASAAIYSMFLYSAANGHVRWYYLASSALGLFLTHISVGKFITKVFGFALNGILLLIYRILSFVFKPLIKLLMLVLTLLANAAIAVKYAVTYRIDRMYTVSQTEEFSIKSSF